jgi:hypothetical protein
MVDAAEKHDCLEAVVARQKEDARKKKTRGRGMENFSAPNCDMLFEWAVFRTPLKFSELRPLTRFDQDLQKPNKN